MEEDKKDHSEEDDNFIIEECVLMVKQTRAGRMEVYTGNISTVPDKSGKNIISGRYEIADGNMWLRSEDREELDNNVDSMAGMIFEGMLDFFMAETTVIARNNFNLN
ncbi:MAG: hypothetical protein ACM3NR_02775 [Methanosarcina sp.]